MQRRDAVERRSYTARRVYGMGQPLLILKLNRKGTGMVPSIVTVVILGIHSARAT